MYSRQFLIYGLLCLGFADPARANDPRDAICQILLKSPGQDLAEAVTQAYLSIVAGSSDLIDLELLKSLAEDPWKMQGTASSFDALSSGIAILRGVSESLGTPDSHRVESEIQRGILELLAERSREAAESGREKKRVERIRKPLVLLWQKRPGTDSAFSRVQRLSPDQLAIYRPFAMFSPDMALMATQEWNSTQRGWGIRIRQTSTGTPITWLQFINGLEKSSDEILRVEGEPDVWYALSPRQDRIAAILTGSQKLKLWSLSPEGGRLLSESSIRLDFPRSIATVALSPDGEHLAIGYTLGDLEIREVSTGHLLTRIRTGLGILGFIDWTNDGERLIVQSYSDRDDSAAISVWEFTLESN